jgi:hypothetical protein
MDGKWRSVIFFWRRGEVIIFGREKISEEEPEILG